MAREFKRKNGKTVLVLTPAEKKKKFEAEIKTGTKLTNYGEVKRDDKGKPIKLTAKEKQYRYGFISSQIENGKLYYKSKERKK